MVGTHRAETPPRRPGRGWLALGIAAVTAAAIGSGYALTRSGDGAPSTPAPTSTPTDTPTSTLTPTSLPTVTITPTSAPTPAPTPSAKALPQVKPSPPRQLIVRGLLDVGFDSVIAPRDGVLTPASTGEVARWGGRGVPGSPQPDTVFVIGKISTRGAFAKLPEVYRGVRVTVRTHTGVLTYTVQATADRPARGLTTDPAFTQAQRGRLQLVGIRYDSHGDRSSTVLVVTAVLTAARASH